MSLQKEISNLLKEGVISAETADKINAYYAGKKNTSGNRLFLIFGILGALLVGLGIILIIAHNWDDLSRSTKTVISFFPLVLGQLWCGYYLLKKPSNSTWQESSSSFLFLAIGASISLISQTYHIQGELGSFLFTWSLLTWPMIFILRSSMASLMYLILITWYTCEVHYWTYGNVTDYYYWLLLLPVLYHVYELYRNKRVGNFRKIHDWMVPISLIICLGSVAHRYDEIMFVSYMSLFGLFYLIGNFDYFLSQKTRNNSFLVLGSLGSMFLLLAMSFEGFWEHIRKLTFEWSELWHTGEFVSATVTTLLAGILLGYHIKKKGIMKLRPLSTLFIVFLITFIIGSYSIIAVILVNLWVFGFGLLTVRQGAEQDHLGILNYGLLIIMALVICRFFDSDLSFVLRGLMFVTVGVGFFIANFWMLKRRRSNES